MTLFEIADGKQDSVLEKFLINSMQAIVINLHHKCAKVRKGQLDIAALSERAYDRGKNEEAQLPVKKG